jgi:hypothetical protein
MNETSSEKFTPLSRSTSRLGVWAAILTTVFALLALGLGITTPPRSGPFCVSEPIPYPYTDAAEYVPRDYLWMYPATLLALVFVVLMACIHRYAPEDRKIFSLVGLSFAVISATALATDYFIQLAVMQPSLIKGETEGLSLFSQYNPHGIFIALEDLGYSMMSVAFLFAAFVFGGREKLERAVRWVFIINFVLAAASLAILAAYYGYDLEYRFECAIILINWVTLIVAGLLLSRVFRGVSR